MINVKVKRLNSDVATGVVEDVYGDKFKFEAILTNFSVDYVLFLDKQQPVSSMVDNIEKHIRASIREELNE